MLPPAYLTVTGTGITALRDGRTNPCERGTVLRVCALASLVRTTLDLATARLFLQKKNMAFNSHNGHPGNTLGTNHYARTKQSLRLFVVHTSLPPPLVHATLAFCRPSKDIEFIELPEQT
jgi:hypothetical protein